MQASGHLRKLKTELKSPVKYTLIVGERNIALNSLLGKKIKFVFQNIINCINCGRETNKSFSQGYCFPCMRSLAECDICMVSPEKCHYHEGSCRQPTWGEEFCFRDHYIYLANTSGLKVGITRNGNIPYRWIDQGATQALPIFRVSNRLLSGKVEVLFKQFVADKTNWRTMLKGNAENISLSEQRDVMLTQAGKDLSALKIDSHDIEILSNEKTIEISYPVDTFPEKVTSLNFDKQEEIDGVLHGIKGQYLILSTGVLNIRKFSGYKVKFFY